MQDSSLLRKINQVLTKRVLKWLEEESKDTDKYAKFFAQHGHCLKEGVATDWSHKEAIAKLLRFKSSHTEGEATTSLADYVSRMPEEHKEIYFLHAPDREAAEASPEFEVFRAKGWEVIFLEDPRDEFVLEHLHSFDGKTLVAAAKADIKLERPEDRSKSLSEAQVEGLVAFLKETFGERVSEVRASERLVGSPAVVREADSGMNANMRRMMKMMGKEDSLGLAAKPEFELNPDHGIIAGLEQLRHSDEGLARQLAGQLLDNAMVSAGLIEDPRAVFARLNHLLEKLIPVKS
jgi:molecular chaperone HtpG